MNFQHPIREQQLIETRRHFFGRTAGGLGSAALASLCNENLFAQPQESTDPRLTTSGLAAEGLPNLPHFAPKAKRVIYLFMSGAPSQLDMWDYKPKMADWYDKDLPDKQDSQLHLQSSNSINMANMARG